MKKLLSLLCALALVAGVNAAPKKDIRASKFTAVHASGLNHRTDKAKALKTVNLAKEAVPSSLRNASLAQPAKLARAKKEATVVAIGSWERGNDWGTDGEYYFYSEDNTIAFMFDIFYPEGESDIALGVTYTEADMDAKYCAVFYDGEWHQGLVTASLTKTLNENGLPHFEGAAKDSLGAEFAFVFDEEPFVPTGEVVAVKIENTARLEYSANYQDWVVRAADKNFEIRLDILSANADSPVGEYSSENGDFDLGYTWIDVLDGNGDAQRFNAHDITASIAERNDSILISGSLIALNGVQYDFDLFYVTPKAEKEETVTASNLNINDAFLGWIGAVIVEASNEDYVVYLTYSPASADDLTGTFTIGSDASGDITLCKQDSTLVDFFSGEISVAKNDDGYTLTGKVLAYNNVEYNLELTYVIPDKTREETITIDNAKILIYEEDGDWLLSGLNADFSRYVSIDIISSSIAGSYTIADIYPDYTYLGNVVEGEEGRELSEQFDPLALDIHVTFNEADSTAHITGTYLGQGVVDAADVPLFTLDINAAVSKFVPAQTETDEPFKIVFPEYTINDDDLESYSVLYAEAQNPDLTYIWVEFNLEPGQTAIAPGLYQVSDTYASGTVSAGSLSGNSIYGSFAARLSSDGNITLPLWLFAEGTVTVHDNGVIEVNAKNSLGAAIECRLGSWPEAVGNTPVNATAAKRLLNGQLLIEKNGNRYNALGSLIK